MLVMMRSAYTVPLLLCYSPLVLSKAFESLDYDDYDPGEDAGWEELGACGRLWADFTDLLAQLADAFGLAFGKSNI